jgi:uncharacterized repeat protein (TIGR01451 family)
MTRKKNVRSSSILTWGLGSALALLLALTAASVGAQSVPTGYQDYFVLGFEQHVWDMMDKVRIGEGAGAFADGMDSVVTAVASADNQILYYDQWEDGLEGNILAPVQGTTLVLGDNNPANGEACDYTTDPRVAPCNGTNDDVLFEGTFLTLNSDQGLSCDRIDCSVPLNPRDPAGDIRFDGGDRIVTSGGPLSVIHNQNPLTQYIGGATENISFQTVEEARSYSIPIGEDIYNTANLPFKYVDIGLVAFVDGTAVYIDSPGESPVSFILDRGQSYSSLGLIDDSPAPAIVINAGTKVSTDHGVTGFIHTGSDGNYATRFYTLLPDLLHSTDYVITAPGDNPNVNGNRPANIYIFNPDPLNSIDVTATDSVGSNVISIPANQGIPYSVGAGRNVPSGSTVRMVSDRRFWGVSAYDYLTWASDWGHSWLARRFLTGIYTVGWSPGSVDGSVNRSPVYVSATQDTTRVQIDLDNDEVFDRVDLDGNGFADPPDIAAGNVYLVDALEALSIFDHTDFDNTGTRIVANKPVAVAWGQETDLGVLGDASLDTGYTIYPINELFLDPVLTIEKLADSETVPLGGGIVTYTLTISSHGYGPLTSLLAYDVLPTGVLGTDYVTGSTLITYPNLVQNTDDPQVSIDPETGRERLDWTLSPDTIGAGQYITIRYQLDLPSAAAPGLLTNTGHAHGTLGSSIFSPISLESVVQTDATMTKTVSSVDPPQVGEPLEYVLTVENTGISNETDVVITDPIPPGTSFLPGSITNGTPFTGAYDPAQNAVVWTASTFSPSHGSVDLGFEAVINPGIEAESIVLNEAGYESDQTPYFLARATIVTTGPRLEFEKRGPAVLHPNETAVFEIAVHNTGVAAANDLTIIDQIPINTCYVAESMAWSLNSGPWQSLTDAADFDQGSVVGGGVEFTETSLGPGEDLVFRFRVLVDPNTSGEFVNNQATIYSTELPPADTNLVQIPIVGDAVITGHLFLDIDGDGTQDPGEPDLAYVDVVITDSQGNTQIVATDSDGNYSVIVEEGVATVDVDETDPDFPTGATLTTSNDPQYPDAISGSSVATTPVGYLPPPVSLIKTSDAPNSVVAPGQVVTYTITLTNNTSVTQTGISIEDVVPVDTTYVAGSSQVFGSGTSKLRSTEYFLPPNGAFSGNTYDLPLDQNLAPDYFVIVRGADGTGGNANADRRTPNMNYVSLTGDPGGTGDLGDNGTLDQLTFTRRGNTDSWAGVITVVECLSDCDLDGFELVDVARIGHTGSLGGTSSLPDHSWSDSGQVLLMGGHQGAGCDTTEAANRNTHGTCHVRFVPSGSNTVQWSRYGEAAWNATSTVMAVEWGSNWNVQNVRVQGNNGGGGANNTGEYNTANLGQSVERANTWVWGSGFTNDNGVGDTAEGCLITLGNGATQNANETEVAVGIEYPDKAVDFQIYIMSHAQLATDYEFKTDGDDGATSVDIGVDAAGAERMALAYNGLDSFRQRWPSPIFSARYVSDSTIRMQRVFSQYEFPAWIQGIDFSDIRNAASVPGGVPPSLVSSSDGYTLQPDESMVVTFQVTIDPDPSAAQITNTATATTNENPTAISATATDDVVKVGVLVEPNNAGYGVPGTSLIYNHVVVNTGDGVDSFDITPVTELGWPVELIDPATGAVLAQDLDADGVWDNGVTINTGSVPAGASVPYDLRVTIPLGTPLDTQQTSGLRATSVRNPSVASEASDETLVVNSLGEIILTPDNSGIITSPGTVAYAHHVVNLTGGPETMNLYVHDSDPANWTSTIHWDTNGDGQYTPGVDLEISNTRELEDDESQLIFVVVTADAGLSAGNANVSSIIAEASTDPAILDGATDTTTVLDAPIDFDLSGGGTRIVGPGDSPVFPGRLRNLGDIDDTYEFTVTAAGYYGDDSLAHPTQLFIDTNDDGAPDLRIAEDSDGDGDWDYVDPAYDTGPDNNPIVAVDAGGSLAYELVRPVDPAQLPYRDPVTLTARSTTSSDKDSVTATNILVTESHAVVASFTAYSAKERVVVEWRTASEVGTVAFDLYRRDSRASSFEKVNRRPLRGVLHAPQGGVYRTLDPSGTRGKPADYLLVEYDVWGGRTNYGPFAVQADELDAWDPRTSGPAWNGIYEAEIRQATVREPGRDRVRGRKDPPGTPSGRAKIAVRDEGLVWVSAPEIATALGIDVALAEEVVLKGLLRLTNRGGEVAWVPEDGGGGLYFFAEAIDSIYTLDNVYWLEIETGLTMKPIFGEPSGPQPGGSFSESLHFEEEYWPTTALIDDPEGDFWMWSPLIPGDATYGIGSFSFSTPAVAEVRGTAEITIHLQGALDSEIDPDHLVKFRLNGAELGETRWDGLDAWTVVYRFPLTMLNSGTNTLEVEPVLVPGSSFDIVYLDSFDVDYARAFHAQEDRLLLSAGRGRIVTVEGFSDPQIQVFDLTDRMRPSIVSDTIIDTIRDGSRVSFRAGPKMTEYLAVATAAAQSPHAISRDFASNLASPDNDGEHLIIAGPGLAGAALALAEYRSATGLTSQVVRLEDIYDEFNHGIASPWAIRDFIQKAAATWKYPPRYVLLAGDGSYDYIDRFGYGANLVPAPQTSTEHGLLVSDNLLADFIGNDGVPDVAIGRLPAQYASELTLFIDKIIAFESSDSWWKRSTLWVADEPDRGGEFSLDLTTLIDGLAPRFLAYRIDLEIVGLDMGRELLANRIDSGAVLMGYLGHAGLNSLAADPDVGIGVLMTSDVANLDNEDRLPVLAAMTCILGRYDMVNGDGLAETLLLRQGGGAIAVWSPSGLVLNDDGVRLGRFFNEAISRSPGLRLGDAVRVALEKFMRPAAADPTVAKLYILLGDPALDPGW